MNSRIDHQKIGQRVREARIGCGLTQEQLAEKVDLSNAFISHIERGHCKMPLETLAILAEALEKPIEYFLLDTPVASKDSLFELEISAKLRKCDKSVLDSLSRIIDILNDQHRADTDR